MSDSEETSVAGDPEIDFDHADLNQTSKAVCSSCEVPITDAYFTLGEQAVCPGCKDSMSKAEPKGWGIARFMYAGMFGTFAGALGSGLWLGVAELTGYNLGIIAILVGFMVGAAVKVGSRERGGILYQLMAVSITYTAIAMTYVPMAVEEMRTEMARQETESITTEA